MKRCAEKRTALEHEGRSGLQNLKTYTCQKQRHGPQKREKKKRIREREDGTTGSGLWRGRPEASGQLGTKPDLKTKLPQRKAGGVAGRKFRAGKKKIILDRTKIEEKDMEHVP